MWKEIKKFCDVSRRSWSETGRCLSCLSDCVRRATPSTFGLGQSTVGVVCVRSVEWLWLKRFDGISDCRLFELKNLFSTRTTFGTRKKPAVISSAHVGRICLFSVCFDKGSPECLVVYDCLYSFGSKTFSIVFALKWLLELVVCSHFFSGHRISKHKKCSPSTIIMRFVPPLQKEISRFVSLQANLCIWCREIRNFQRHVDRDVISGNLWTVTNITAAIFSTSGIFCLILEHNLAAVFLILATKNWSFLRCHSRCVLEIYSCNSFGSLARKAFMPHRTTNKTNRNIHEVVGVLTKP